MRPGASIVAGLLALVAACSTAAPAGPPPVSAPRVLVLDGAALAETRAAVVAGDAGVAPAVAELRKAADAALAAAPVSVTEKAVAAPSGDAHDYVSLSIYWWPDPAKPGGLPYVQRDGVIDPESADLGKYDAGRLTRMVGTVETLALAAYLTGERGYGDGAARWLRAWFVDPSTRMNPSMRYSQIIPGRTELRGTGIIDSRQLLRAIDAALLLDGTPFWSATDQAALRAWFDQLADWLLTSAQGQMEGKAANNHGSWYDAQVAGFALFAGRAAVARDLLAQAGAKRVAAQLAPDGSQKLELARTRSYHYSVFNLIALAILSDLAPAAGVDLWHASSDRLKAGIDLLVPYVERPKAWPYPELGGVDFGGELAPVLVRAARAYPAAGYDAVLAPLVAKLTPLGRLKLRIGAFGSLGGTAVAPPTWAL